MLELIGGSVGAAALMAVPAVLVGSAQDRLGGLTVVSVAIVATLLPAQESTAAILVVLVVGDLVAIRRPTRRRLDPHPTAAPHVLPGLVVGSLFLGVVSDAVLRRSLGGSISCWSSSRCDAAESAHPYVAAHEHPAAARTAGAGVGFATMTANAAGAVTTTTHPLCLRHRKPEVRRHQRVILPPSSTSSRCPSHSGLG